MAADGSVDFEVRLVNQVTGPAKQIQRSMAAVKGSVESARRALEAPAPQRSPLSDWDKMMAKSRLSQAADNARQQSRIAKLNAADQARATKLKAAEQAKAEKKATLTAKKEAQRVADYQLGLKQTKLDQQGALASSATSMLGYGTAAVATAALAAAAAVGYLAVKFSIAAVEAAAFGERSRKALGLLLDSAGAGAVQFDSLRKEAAGLGLDIESTQLSYQKLLAAQFSVGKSRELIRMGSDLQAIGANAEDVKGVLLAITQIKSKGKLQAEEMLQLQERGISAELVYEALGKRMGKSKAELMGMQQKGQLGGPEAIDAILDAVRKKTNTEFAGQAGEQFAKTTLTGMLGVWKARGKNMMIDIGDAILPGVTTLAKKLTDGLDSFLNNPTLGHIGRFLLLRFEYFTLWVEAEWPSITEKLTAGLQTVSFAIEFLVDMLDMGTVKGKIAAGIMLTLATAFAILAIAALPLVLPLYLLLAAVGAVAYGIYKAVMWVVDAFKSLPKFAQVGLATAALATPGGGMVPTSLSGGKAITTAAESGPGAALGGALSSFNPAEAVTVQGEEQNAQKPANHFDFSNMNVGTGVDRAALVADIRSQVTKALEEA